MSKFKLKPFQETAVVNLVKKIKKLVHSKHQTTKLVFKSGTGSGKTIMVAEVLKRLDSEPVTKDCVYIWTSKGGLHEQSYHKLSDYLKGAGYNLLVADKYIDYTDAELPAKTILFVNWEKVFSKDKDNNWSNILTRENESGKNILNVMEATRAAGRNVVLIVDEAHSTYLGENSQELVQSEIKPKLTLEVSATPLLEPTAAEVAKGEAHWEEVPFGKVAASGLIKEQTVINHDLGGVAAKAPNEMILEAAMKQREVMVQHYATHSKKDINPLVLIQLPSKAKSLSNLDKSIRTEVETYLETQGITYDNGKLGIWLADAKSKINLDEIEELDNEVEYLIFKQAIALGWDCPRACILVMFRDIKSPSFKLQTVGRILRMPEALHYPEPEMNQAYVFTNLEEITIDPDANDAKGHFKIQYSKLRDDITNITLPNVYFHRTDYNDLTADFTKILEPKLTAAFGIKPLDKKRKEKIEASLETTPDALTQPVLTNVVIKNLDEVDAEVAGEVLDLEVDDVRLESLFNLVLRSWVTPYGYERSAGRLKPFLYMWFGHAGFTPRDVQRIIACSEKNQETLGEIIAEAKAEFENQRHANIASKRIRTDTEFKLPLTDSFPGDYTQKSFGKHALQPYFYDNKWKTEERFENYLEQCDEVVWWYKNGVRQLRYFAVPFIKLKEDGTQAPAGFYPDYIVHYTSGKYGIYDTKGGDTVKSEDTKRKAEALQDYLANTLKNANFRGGIVDSKTNNTFLLNTSNIYDHTDKTQWTQFAPF